MGEIESAETIAKKAYWDGDASFDDILNAIRRWGEAQREAGRAEAEPDVFKRVFGVATPEPLSLVDLVARNQVAALCEAVDKLTEQVRSLETSAR